jgi:hypothetical protein
VQSRYDESAKTASWDPPAQSEYPTQEDPLLSGLVLIGRVPQPQGAPPPGQLEGAPPGAAEFVICDCTIEAWLKDLKQLLGLGQYQNRPYRAAVIHLHLVCFAYALLTHLRIERKGAQGQWIHATAADLSTATAQDQLRGLLWGDLIISLKEKRHGPSVIEELERLRVA